MEAAIFFDSYLPEALRQALDYAADDGFVASLPALLHARANAPYDNVIWNTWFTSNTEESVVTTKQGNHLVVAIHGGGIYAAPERFERLYRANQARFDPEGFTGDYAGKISAQEARDVQSGKLPDGTEVPVFSFAEFRRGIAKLPRRYGVILDFKMARKSKKGFQSFVGSVSRQGAGPSQYEADGKFSPLRPYQSGATAGPRNISGRQQGRRGQRGRL
jgi:hypothetical protein